MPSIYRVMTQPTYISPQMHHMLACAAVHLACMRMRAISCGPITTALSRILCAVVTVCVNTAFMATTSCF